jgi:hypothetical protein
MKKKITKNKKKEFPAIEQLFKDYDELKKYFEIECEEKISGGITIITFNYWRNTRKSSKFFNNPYWIEILENKVLDEFKLHHFLISRINIEKLRLLMNRKTESMGSLEVRDLFKNINEEMKNFPVYQVIGYVCNLHNLKIKMEIYFLLFKRFDDAKNIANIIMEYHG